MTIQEKTILTSDDINSQAPQQIAMVYRNEYDEVSYISESGTPMLGGGIGNIALVFVLSLVALVTISRRSMS